MNLINRFKTQFQSFSLPKFHLGLMDRLEYKLGKKPALAVEQLLKLSASSLAYQGIRSVFSAHPLTSLPCTALCTAIYSKYIDRARKTEIQQLKKQTKSPARKNLVLFKGTNNDRWLVTKIWDKIFGSPTLPNERWILKKFSQTHNIKVVEIETKEQLTNQLKDIKEQSVDVAIFCGHGSPNNFAFSDQCYLNLTTRDQLGEIGRKISSNGKVVFNSCNTGKGKNNLGKIFSKYTPPNATIYAPQGPVSIDSGLSFNQSEEPSYKYWFQNIQASIYQNGKPL